MVRRKREPNRIAGLDEKILAFYARGNSAYDIGILRNIVKPIRSQREANMKPIGDSRIA